VGGRGEALKRGKDRVAGFTALEAGDPAWLGRYRIVARLGRGGMGRVYLGRSPSGRAVAVKVVRPELAEDPGFRRRFVREVEAARRVTGFFTAAVVDAAPQDTPPWLATAYVPAISLDEAVVTYGTWPKQSVLALGTALAEALEAIHRADVVHRDLKPSNVLLAADGPRVIDFGISVAAEATALTQTGVAIGTPGFISPEQLVGRNVGPAGDVFALGGVLAYTATGSGPFGSGSAHAVNYRVVHEEPDLTGLPPALGIVARCLAKDPERRPTVGELVETLARASGRADRRVLHRRRMAAAPRRRGHPHSGRPTGARGGSAALDAPAPAGADAPSVSAARLRRHRAPAPSLAEPRFRRGRPRPRPRRDGRRGDQPLLRGKRGERAVVLRDGRPGLFLARGGGRHGVRGQ
jgi:hypothetical protein